MSHSNYHNLNLQTRFPAVCSDHHDFKSNFGYCSGFNWEYMGSSRAMRCFINSSIIDHYSIDPNVSTCQKSYKHLFGLHWNKKELFKLQHTLLQTESRIIECTYSSKMTNMCQNRPHLCK